MNKRICTAIALTIMLSGFTLDFSGMKGDKTPEAQEPSETTLLQSLSLEAQIKRWNELTKDLVFLNDSPDNAVKSWWKYQDAKVTFVAQNCEIRVRLDSVLHNSEFQVPTLRKVADGQILAGPTKKASNKVSCRHGIYTRVIQSVHTESSTRATVLAQISNAIALAKNVVLSQKTLDKRKKGELFRYVVEKDQVGKWRVSQVFEQYSFSNEFYPRYGSGISGSIDDYYSDVSGSEQ